MSLTVEDGTIVSGADSYISVVDADTYFSNRGATAWAALTNSVKEQSLRKATVNYLDAVYNGRWLGSRVSSDQVLDWPRQYVVFEGFEVATTTIPDKLKYACAELALRSSSAELLLDEDQKIIREQIGPIDVTYQGGASQLTKYSVVEELLKPLLYANSRTNRLMRS